MSKPIALYIHWPFCKAKCPYCDFNSHVRPAADRPRFAAALLRELQSLASRLGPRPLSSIFFGGGTPSLMDTASVAALIDAAMRAFPPIADCEITLEANPTSVEAEKFKELRAAGVNRLSLGVQSLHDETLRFLGREHSVTEALHAVALAQTHFARVSFDLIYAHRGQTAKEWDEDLTRALAFGTEHLSLYQLTLEPSTPFLYRAQRGEALTVGEDDAAELYAITQARMEAAGLPAYEISNHARPGAESRHNLAYWRYQDYAGLGPGAHGRLSLDGKVYATVGIRAPEGWALRVEAEGVGTDETLIDLETQKREALLMGLRLREGIDLAVWQKRFGEPLTQTLDLAAVLRLKGSGHVEMNETTLRATRAGALVLNTILSEIIRG